MPYFCSFGNLASFDMAMASSSSSVGPPSAYPDTTVPSPPSAAPQQQPAAPAKSARQQACCSSRQPKRTLIRGIDIMPPSSFFFPDDFVSSSSIPLYQTNPEVESVDDYYPPEPVSPWSEIITKYLNGIAQAQFRRNRRQQPRLNRRQSGGLGGGCSAAAAGWHHSGCASGASSVSSSAVYHSSGSTAAKGRLGGQASKQGKEAGVAQETAWPQAWKANSVAMGSGQEDVTTSIAEVESKRPIKRACSSPIPPSAAQQSKRSMLLLPVLPDSADWALEGSATTPAATINGCRTTLGEVSVVGSFCRFDGVGFDSIFAGEDIFGRQEAKGGEGDYMISDFQTPSYPEFLDHWNAIPDKRQQQQQNSTYN